MNHMNRLSKFTNNFWTALSRFVSMPLCSTLSHTPPPANANPNSVAAPLENKKLKIEDHIRLSPDYMHQLSLMAHQMSQKAKHDPKYKDAARTLHSAYIKLGDPKNRLPR